MMVVMMMVMMRTHEGKVRYYKNLWCEGCWRNLTHRDASYKTMPTVSSAFFFGAGRTPPRTPARPHTADALRAQCGRGTARTAWHSPIAQLWGLSAVCAWP